MITIMKQTKNYLTIRLPRKTAVELGFVPNQKRNVIESEILRRAREAAELARKKRLPILKSLRDLR